MFGHKFAAHAERFGVPVGLWVSDLVHGVEGDNGERRDIGIQPLLVHGWESLLVGIELGLEGGVGRSSAFALKSFGVLFDGGNVFADFGDGDEGPCGLEYGSESAGAEPLFDGIDFEWVGVHEHESEVGAVSGDDGGLHADRGIRVGGIEDFNDFGAAVCKIDWVEQFEGLLIDAVVDVQAVPAFGHFHGGFGERRGVWVGALHGRCLNLCLSGETGSQISST
ncbi:MAG: hypothetical protein RLZZ458_983 [Planctomycetota bacterium]